MVTARGWVVDLAALLAIQSAAAAEVGAPPRTPVGPPPAPSEAQQLTPAAQPELVARAEPGAPLRSAGIAMMVVGGLLALGSPVAGYAALQDIEGNGCGWAGGDPLTILGCAYTLGVGIAIASVATVAGLILEGIGAKLYATGHARTVLHSRAAVGRSVAFWVGWVLGGVAAIGMWTGVAQHSSALQITGLTADIGATAAFGIGMGTASSSLPRPSMSAVREPSGATTPTFGLAMQF